jgi:hypothetical protein
MRSHTVADLMKSSHSANLGHRRRIPRILRSGGGAACPELERSANAEWQESVPDLEALLRKAMLIEELRPTVNVQIGAPDLDARADRRGVDGGR